MAHPIFAALLLAALATAYHKWTPPSWTSLPDPPENHDVCDRIMIANFFDRDSTPLYPVQWPYDEEPTSYYMLSTEAPPVVYQTVDGPPEPEEFPIAQLLQGHIEPKKYSKMIIFEYYHSVPFQLKLHTPKYMRPDGMGFEAAKMATLVYPQPHHHHWRPFRRYTWTRDWKVTTKNEVFPMKFETEKKESWHVCPYTMAGGPTINLLLFGFPGENDRGGSVENGTVVNECVRLESLTVPCVEDAWRVGDIPVFNSTGDPNDSDAE